MIPPSFSCSAVSRALTAATSSHRRCLQTAASVASNNSAATASAVWSGHMSFASPESDFTGHSPAQQQQHLRDGRSEQVWSGNLSFASPESDFSAADTFAKKAPRSFSDILPVRAPKSHEFLWSNSMSFGSPESDFCASTHVAQQQQQQETAAVLPQTLAEAMESNQAVVVTTVEMPHRIVHVNKAWEDLCGYTQQEVLHKTLRVIQGDATNTKLANKKIAELVKQKKPSDMYVVNYKKNGQSFTNHVSMGTMKLSEQETGVEFLVGVLQQVKNVPLKLAY